MKSRRRFALPPAFTLRGLFGAVVMLAALFAFAAILQWRRVGQNEHIGHAVAIDGDSLRLNGVELRLKGLDAPEYLQSCADAAGRDYDCGKQARRALSARLRRGEARCIESETDKYGRGLVRCAVGDEDIGAALVQDGIAVAFGDYLREEDEARAARRGLWSGSFERPADWRRRHPRPPRPGDVAP